MSTTAPNIEMIASSLRHCNLDGGGGRHRAGDDDDGVTVDLNSDVALPYHWEQCLDIRTGQVYYINWEDGTRTTVDPRTSSAFTLSSPTPRSASSSASRRASAPSSGYTSVSSSVVGAEEEVVAAWPRDGDVDSGYDDDNEEEGDADDEDEGDDYEDEDDDYDDEEESGSTTCSSSSSSSRGSAVSSTLSSFSPTDESASGDNGGPAIGHVLVAAGCRACFMYFMVPKRSDVCPKCGNSGLLHLSRNGYA